MAQRPETTVHHHRICGRPKQTKLQSYLKGIDMKMWKLMTDYLSSHTMLRSNKFTLYHDILIIYTYKSHEKEINRNVYSSKATQIAKHLQMVIEFTSSSIKDRMQKKLVNVDFQTLKYYIEENQDLSFNSKKQLMVEKLKSSKEEADLQEHFNVKQQLQKLFRLGIKSETIKKEIPAKKNTEIKHEESNREEKSVSNSKIFFKELFANAIKIVTMKYNEFQQETDLEDEYQIFIIKKNEIISVGILNKEKQTLSEGILYEESDDQSQSNQD